MRRTNVPKSVFAFIIVLLAIFILAGCGGGGGSENPKLTKISDIKGADMQSYIGLSITLDGYFVKDPRPIIVADLKYMYMNMVIPEDQFILLTGDQAEQISAEENGGNKLRIDGVVTALDNPQLYGTEKVSIATATYSVIDNKYLYKPVKIAVSIIEALKDHRYAILFSGGYNSYNNHIRYWNDLKFMYATLVNKYGFAKSNITVLYADGTALDSDMPVDYSATQANLETAVNYLKEMSTDEDLIFVFTTDHGGGFYQSDPHPNNYGGRLDSSGDEGTEPLLEATYGIDFNGDGDHADQVAWDEELYAWGGHIYDDALTSILDGTLHYSNLIIVMEQCFSAGLIPDMASGGSNRIIMAAATQYEPSWAMPPSYSFDEFSYFFTSALNGAKPDGAVVNADINGDTKVSIVEAYNYARSNDSRPETPNYEDSGDGVPHTGAMPGGGDGTLGNTISLD